ncbi:MAG: hypothetical protein IJP33_03950 [Firmicutes bacterium]|nr:hypothetical protein [Bacillota bacterium]
MDKKEKALIPKDRKTLLKLGGIFATGLVLIFFSGLMGTTPESKIDVPAAEHSTALDMEQKLEKILSQIKGAGKVAVCLNYSTLLHKEYAVNENSSQKTQNENAAERSISTVEKTTGKTYFTAGAQNEPLLLQEYSPVPESVLIVAEGAGNARIREELFSAVQAFLGLPANKISISEMK